MASHNCTACIKIGLFSLSVSWVLWALSGQTTNTLIFHLYRNLLNRFVWFHLWWIPTCPPIKHVRHVKNISCLPDKMSGIQCSAWHLNPLSDIFLSWWLANILLKFLSPLPNLFLVLNPGGQNVRQCLSPLSDISRSLPGMSGICRKDCIFKAGYTLRDETSPLRGVTANVLVLLHYAIHLSITNTPNCHYIQWCSPLP